MDYESVSRAGLPRFIGALEWLPMKDAPSLESYARFLLDVQGIFCWDGC
jgi:hypothetical protein